MGSTAKQPRRRYQRLGARVAGEGGEGLVDVHKTAVDVGYHDTVGRLLDGRAQEALCRVGAIARDRRGGERRDAHGERYLGVREIARLTCADDDGTNRVALHHEGKGRERADTKAGEALRKDAKSSIRAYVSKQQRRARSLERRRHWHVAEFDDGTGRHGACLTAGLGERRECRCVRIKEAHDTVR